MRKHIRSIVLAAAAVAAFAVPALAESTLCTITAPEMRLRKSPSKKAKVVAILKKDTKVTAAQCSGGWVKVSSEDGKLNGYVGGWALASAPTQVAEAPATQVSDAAPSTVAQKEVPSNEKLAMQITELRLNVLGIERDMQQMHKEIRKIKSTLRRRK
ncbi:SH3 type 3 domain protein [Citrifermentans bremense]|uniref:Peptide-binding protein n=2 Tax=Geobacteraceae TaxID=213422 RepID=A0ABQ0MIP4_9BACT|nr:MULTISPECIES: SH3 domain-containing protein [Geobacteraceae]BCG46625.1 SH3 type 3 domain protein [Citrifermentans bremense]GAW66939.1 peptide-binding protein [Geoanaerobacter pelophilus]